MAASQILHLGGARWINQILNGSIARPANLYILLRILNGGGNPADAAPTDTLTSNLSEVSGSGYARQALAFNSSNFPEMASGNSSLLTSAQVTFSFTGTVTGVTHAAIATTSDNTGVLVASAPLATTRNFANGDSEKIIFTLLMEQGA